MLPQFSDAFAGEEHQAFMWDTDGDCAALLVHGYPGTPDEMRPLAHALYDEGWAVKAVLLPGFGEDIATLADRRHEEWIGAVETALLDLQARYQQVILFGNSMGGAISIALAAKHRVDGLVLFAPFIRFEHILWRALPVLRYVFPKFKPFQLFTPDFDDPQTVEDMRAFLQGVDLSDPEVREQIMDFEVPITMLNEIRQLGVKAEQSARRVTVPTLIYQGVADDVVAPATTRNLVQSWRSDVIYREVQGSHDLLDTESMAWSTICSGLLSYIKTLR